MKTLTTCSLQYQNQTLFIPKGQALTFIVCEGKVCANLIL